MEMIYQRDVYGKTLVELGRENKDIVVLDADLSSSTRTKIFAEEFPEQFRNIGVAEQNLMATAAGLASCSKIVFASTFAMFAAGRAWDQVRNSICYNRLNVKIVATHAGLSVGPDGASHQALEDIALMRAIPNMNIIVPCDGPQTREAIIAAARTPGPFYIRLGRAKFLTLENKGEFVFGKAQVLMPGNDAAIISCGLMVNEAVSAAEALLKRGIRARVINMHTIRPLDAGVIRQAAEETRGIVVCEEHSAVGGLTSAVDEVVTETHPVRVKGLNVRGRFGQSGDPSELLKEYKLTSGDIEKAAADIVTGNDS
ncbi:MAG: transketolase family protein [Candidatus Omnitrophota bacterium]|jgi:transketolase